MEAEMADTQLSAGSLDGLGIASEESLADFIYETKNYTECVEKAGHLWPILSRAAAQSVGMPDIEAATEAMVTFIWNEDPKHSGRPVPANVMKEMMPIYRPLAQAALASQPSPAATVDEHDPSQYCCLDSCKREGCTRLAEACLSKKKTADHPRFSAATEPETRYDEPAIPHAIKAITAWQANKATSYTPTDVLNDCGDAILAALYAAEPQPIATAPKDGTEFIGYENGDVYKCCWRTEEPDEGPGHSGWYDFSNSSFENPTEWSPLRYSVVPVEPQPALAPTDLNKVWEAAEACWASDAPRKAVDILYYEIIRLNGGSVTGGAINKLSAPARCSADMEDDLVSFTPISGPAVDALETRKESDNGPTEARVNEDLRKRLSTGTVRGCSAGNGDKAREIVTDWLSMFDPPPQIDFQQSELLQGAIAAALGSVDIDALTGTADDQVGFGILDELPLPVSRPHGGGK
jgi:hypothetical protein